MIVQIAENGPGPAPVRRDRSMSLLRVALRLILRVNICLHHASRRTRMVWGGLPGTVQQFHATQLLENHATPILLRPDRPQSALALAAILIAEHARLSQAIATQPVRAKQPGEFFVDGADRSLNSRLPSKSAGTSPPRSGSLASRHSSQLHDTARGGYPISINIL